MKVLLTGNEAVAIGAYEAGVLAATGYPGTPATEIIEAIAHYPKVYTEWSVNEKTALELSSGFSLSGKRALVAMKHVGLNVASDPLMSLAYTGVNSGLVIAVSDDPGMWSSQSEQDSRLFGPLAHIPILEPSDSEDAYIFTKQAFILSERFDLPIIIRLTRAISHTSTIVNIDGLRIEQNKEYTPDVEKNVLLPPFTSLRKISLQQRIKRFQEHIPASSLNRIEMDNSEKGIITSGISYQYVREVMPDVSVFKLGIVYPADTGTLKKFASSVKELFVVEELEPFIENIVRAEGINVKGKREGIIPESGELNPLILNNVLSGNSVPSGEMCENNHATLCPGCPYLGVFYALNQKNLFVGGDIGCYTLSVHSFPKAFDTTICMGSGISQAAGFSLSTGKKTVAVIGDSTFFHSGIPAVLNAIYHKANILILVLDNHTTSMTGGQPHIGTGKGIRGVKEKQKIGDILKGCGIAKVRTANAYNLEDVNKTISEGLSAKGVSAIVIDGECVLNKKKNGLSYYIDKGECSLCNDCLNLQCKAINKRGQTIHIISEECNGCGLCIQLCDKGIIKKTS